MKYLLLLLSFNTFAIERLIVTQLDGGQYQSEFETEELAIENLKMRILKKDWMKCDWKLAPHALGLERMFQSEENLEIEVVKSCHPKTFTYSVMNIDSEIAAKALKDSERTNEITQVKAIVENINSSDLPVWHKKLLKHLIREHHRD